MIATALKRGMASEADVRGAIDSMLTLNRAACERMLEFDVHGCTDVTGFGLIGHAREMALGSGVTLEIEVGCVQFLPGAVEYARAGAIPGGLKNNRSSPPARWSSARAGCPRDREPAVRSADVRRTADLAAGDAMRRNWYSGSKARIGSGGF